MNKRIFVCLFVLIFLSEMDAQEVIKNPAKLLNPDAGREVELEEVLRISDESGEFFFKNPRSIKVAPDGSIYIYDREQLIHLDKNGKFQKNLFVKGQGPGELTSISNYFFYQELLVIHNTRPNKIIWMDYEGKMVKEFTIYDLQGSLSFCFFENKNYYFFKHEFQETGGKPEIMDLPHQLYRVAQEGVEVNKLGSFPVKSLVISQGGLRGLVPIGNFRVKPYQNRYIFLSQTREYLIKIYDVHTQKILRSFSRNYTRVKTPEDSLKGGVIFNGKEIYPPRQKYTNDISNLFVRGDLLWVATSTKVKKKGYLVDVFNFEGEYVDALYLNISGKLYSVQEDSFFVQEKDKDELISFIQYRIIQ